VDVLLMLGAIVVITIVVLALLVVVLPPSTGPASNKRPVKVNVYGNYTFKLLLNI